MHESIYSAIGLIISSLGGGAVIILALSSWLGKLWAKRILKKEIEEIRNKFRIIESEHSIKFASLHSRRAEVIAEIYSLLSEVEIKSRLLATPILESGERAKEETYRETATLMNELFEKFNKNKIYLLEETCEKIDDFINKSNIPMSFFRVLQHVNNQDPTGDTFKNDITDKYMKMWEEVELKVPKARKAIEDEFRKILGV